MSLARKCNRCKSFFDPFDSPGRMARFENPIFQTSHEIREQVRGELLDKSAGPDGIIDLCPRCSVLFRDFMNPPTSVKEAAERFNAALEMFSKCTTGQKPTPTFPKEITKK